MSAFSICSLPQTELQPVSKFCTFTSKIGLMPFHLSPVPLGSHSASSWMLPAASSRDPPLSLLLHSNLFPHTFYQCTSDHVTSSPETLQRLLIPLRIKPKRISVHLTRPMLCSSDPSHVPLPLAGMWRAWAALCSLRSYPPELFSTSGPHLDTCPPALSTANFSSPT